MTGSIHKYINTKQKYIFSLTNIRARNTVAPLEFWLTGIRCLACGESQRTSVPSFIALDQFRRDIHFPPLPCPPKLLGQKYVHLDSLPVLPVATSDDSWLR